MLHTGNYLADQLLIPFLLWILIAAGLTGIALGVCLIADGARTLRLLGTMNRWISMRRSLKPMEQPHDIGKAVYRYPRWFGIAFAIAGAFAIFMLVKNVEAAAVVSALGGSPARVVVTWVVESLRWILVAGGVLAVVVGAILVFSADALRSWEARANQWISSRRLVKGADTMHLTLDRWVATSPRVAGWMIALGSTILLVASIIVWFGQR
jgi:hypothetical protein